MPVCGLSRCLRTLVGLAQQPGTHDRPGPDDVVRPRPPEVERHRVAERPIQVRRLAAGLEGGHRRTPPDIPIADGSRYGLTMAVRSLGYRSDLMLLGLQGSVVDRRDGYLAVRTPAN